MGVVMERWCPTQPVLGVFLEETEVKKLLLIGIVAGSLAVPAIANAQRESGNYMADPTHPRLSMGPPNSYCWGPSPTRFTCGPRQMQPDRMQPLPLPQQKKARR